MIFTPFQAITEIECFPTSHAVPTEWLGEGGVRLGGSLNMAAGGGVLQRAG